MAAVESPRNAPRITVPPPTVASAGGRAAPRAPAVTMAEPRPPVAMGQTPKPSAQPVAMGETPKPPAQPVAMGETPKPPAQPVVRIEEDSFVSEATVDGWVRAGAAVRAGCCLTAGDGRRFLLRDAVRVLGRRNGDTDPYGFTGRVEALREFIRRGASISADALRLGPAVYDVEYGFVATPAEVGARVM